MIEILIGMIASGKSTYSRKRAEEGAFIVSNDDIVNCVHGGLYKKYDYEYKPVYEDIKMAIVSGALNNKKDVIIDGTNQKLLTRKRYLDIAKWNNEPIIAVMFKVEKPEIHAQRRVNADSRGYDLEYWTKVAQFHLDSYEPVSLDEGFTEIKEYVYNHR